MANGPAAGRGRDARRAGIVVNALFTGTAEDARQLGWEHVAHDTGGAYLALAGPGG